MIQTKPPSSREHIAIAVGTAGLVLLGYPSAAAVAAAAYLLATGVVIEYAN